MLPAMGTWEGEPTGGNDDLAARLEALQAEIRGAKAQAKERAREVPGPGLLVRRPAVALGGLVSLALAGTLTGTVLASSVGRSNPSSAGAKRIPPLLTPPSSQSITHQGFPRVALSAAGARRPARVTVRTKTSTLPARLVVKERTAGPSARAAAPRVTAALLVAHVVHQPAVGNVPADRDDEETVEIRLVPKRRHPAHPAHPAGHSDGRKARDQDDRR